MVYGKERTTQKKKMIDDEKTQFNGSRRDALYYQQ